MRHCIRLLVVLSFTAVLTVAALAATVRPTGSVVAGEIVVKVRDGATANDIAALERVADADHSKRLAKVQSGTLWRMHSRSQSADALAKALQHNPNVAFAEPNFVVRLVSTPDDPLYPQLWGLKNSGQPIGGAIGAAGADIDVEAAWNVSKGSSSIVVGIVDTGIDYTHPDLAANMWVNPGGKGNAACAAGTFGFNAITGTCDPKDDHHHGTHVAGTIGAVGNNGAGVTGVNWTVSLMALKFLSSSGSGTIADAIEAIDFAVQAKIDGVNVRVLSNSWGGGPFSKALLDVINKANEHDILFVASAGNDSWNNDFNATYPANYAVPNVISVAATDNGDGLAWFSNYGATTVHLGAPGVSVLSTVPGGGYQYLNGTSMAAPHVSGVAALVLAQTPSLTTAELKTILLDSVDPIPSLSGKTITGGRLNAAKAVGAPASPDFTLKVAPSSRAVVRGNSTPFTISIVPSNGFSGEVGLTVAGLPPGVTATFNPTSTSTNSTLTVTTGSSTPLYPSMLTITGTSGAMTRVAFVQLTPILAAPSGACPSFVRSWTYNGPFSAVTTGDFNRDGRIDIAATDADADRVIVRLGAASGGLLAPIVYGVGATPLSIAVADFNGDGNADLATANGGSQNVSILLGGRDGRFQAATHVPASSSPFALAAGDFNRDGKADLAVANNGASNVSILLGAGDGTFAAAVSYAAGSGPFWVTVTDVDRDGKLDLAVANHNAGSVSLVRGNGDGTFQPALNIAAGQKPSSVAAGDFNRDGAVDLAVANFASNDVSLLAGNGNGTFAAAVPLAVGANPYSVAAGDLNGDGRLDLVTADSGSARLSILIAGADGSFLSATSFATEAPQQATLADFSGDGKPDIIVAAQGAYGYGLALIRNTSDCVINCGTLGSAAFYSAGSTPESIARGDFNGDGKLDLVAVNQQSNNVSVKLGNGDGTFAAGATAAAGTAPHGVAAGDFNRDGRLDLAVASTGSNQVVILLGNGDGAFQSPVLYAAGNEPRGIAAGDFDRDGKPDLAVAARGANAVSILRGTGSGTFEAVVSYAAGTSPEGVAIGDFNRDGRADLVVANSGSANVSVLLGDAGGTFQAATQFAAGTTPSAVTADDLDGDGRTDIAVANAGSSDVSVLLGEGDATFRSAASYPVGDAPYGLVAVDLNTDGRLDLVTANRGTNSISVLTAIDGGGYLTASDSGAGTAPSSVVAGDFNRDGTADLAVAASGAATVGVLLNSCPIPDLTVTKTHSGTFTQGQSGKTYTITVQNIGTAATSGNVTMLDALPAGLVATAMSGSGWTCTVMPASCTRSDALGAAASYPPITLTVKVSGSAPASVTNTVTVAGGGELNTLNNVASDPTTIAPAIDLSITTSHTGSFAQGATGRAYTIRVRNIGGLATSGTVTVTDTLPAGLTATAVSGSGWVCTLASLTCTRSNSLAGSSDYPPITVTVNIAANAPASVTNTTTVTGGGDANPSNNTASDPTVIWASQTCGAFGSPRYIDTDSFAISAAVADFNEDGKQDIASIGHAPISVSIFLGNGDGTFTAGSVYSVASFPHELVAGDVNGDGHADLVVGVGSGDGTIMVLLGNGDGTFAQEARFSAEFDGSVTSIALGDLNSDSLLDVAATSAWDRKVYVFLGNGDGSLQPAAAFDTLSGASSVTIADLNGNAAPDLIVGVYGGVVVLAGNGNGTFAAAVNHDISGVGTVGALTAGDFNGDGVPDLAVSSYYSGVDILLGAGDGTFRAPAEYDGTYGISWMTTSDINADGKLDLIAATSSYSGVAVFLGRGDGTLGSPSFVFSGTSSREVSVSDFNGDGKADLLVVNNSNALTVLLGGCPDLSIAKSHSGNFRGGQSGALYTITVKNVGSGGTAGAITVRDVLPAGLTATSFYGGWPFQCDQSTLTCTSTSPLPSGQTATFTLFVNVSSAAPTSVTNTATVSGGGDTNSANNSASDPTSIVHAADLTIRKSHVGAFAPDQPGVYTITVGNVGTGPTSGTVTVVDWLPSGLTASAMSGQGWTCDLGSTTCTTSAVLGVTQTYPPITLTVGVTNVPLTTVTNIATVSGGGELVTSNNTAYDQTAFLFAPAAAATAVTDKQISVTWTNVPAATTYEVWRSSDRENFGRVGTTITPLFLDTSVAPNATYRYKVRALSGAVGGPFGQADLATTFVFTDDPIVANRTRIKALHVQELRTAVNLVRAAAGLPAKTFGDAVVAGQRIKASHLTAIRDALDEARAVFGQSSAPLSPGVATGYQIRSVHVMELRNLMK